MVPQIAKVSGFLGLAVGAVGLSSLLAAGPIRDGADQAPPLAAAARWIPYPSLEAPSHGLEAAKSRISEVLGRAPWGSIRERPAARGAYPLYDWPLDRALGYGTVLVNYADHDATAGILDYDGGDHSYDGHLGTDITLHSFRLMDEGTAILAASPGTVAFTSASGPHAFDRHCDSATWDNDGNWVAIDNGDGTYAFYLHLRQSSLAVELGEPVQTGQFLGLVGSSGYSTGPHLHFETGDYFSGPYAWRDPFTGSINTMPSLWLDQTSYVGDNPLRVFDIGIFSEDAIDGGIVATDFCDIMEGIHEPAVFGITEPQLDVWVQLQANLGDLFRIEVVRPDDTIWGFYEDALWFDGQYGWFWVWWPWNGSVDAADVGIWTVRGYNDNELTYEHTFDVGLDTLYGPRFQPAGRSFYVDGSTQVETLQLTESSPAATLSLIGAPPGVSLLGNDLTIGPVSSQPHRSAFFTVEAMDGAGRIDVAHFHLVDFTKIPIEVSTVPEQPSDPFASGEVLRLSATPNPARGYVTLSYDLAGPAPVHIAIFDARGRKLQGWDAGRQNAGRHTWTWNPQNDHGAGPAAGTYFAQLVAGPHRAATRITLLDSRE